MSIIRWRLNNLVSADRDENDDCGFKAKLVRTIKGDCVKEKSMLKI